MRINRFGKISEISEELMHTLVLILVGPRSAGAALLELGTGEGARSGVGSGSAASPEPSPTCSCSEGPDSRDEALFPLEPSLSREDPLVVEPCNIQ